MTSPELTRVAELANRLAERTLAALEHGRLTTEEFRESPDVALILNAATLLQAAGAEFPGGIVRLAQKAANADLMGSRPASGSSTASLQQRAEAALSKLVPRAR